MRCYAIYQPGAYPSSRIDNSTYTRLEDAIAALRRAIRTWNAVPSMHMYGMPRVMRVCGVAGDRAYYEVSDRARARIRRALETPG